MCTPSTPKVEKLPVRAMTVLPDGGDASVRGAANRAKRLTATSAMIANRGGTLGSPTVSGPIGTGGM